MSDKLWGGRFTGKAAEWVDEFGASIGFDYRLAEEDLEGSLAHVKMLGQQGIISVEEAEQISAACTIFRLIWPLARWNFPLPTRIST